MVLIPEDLEPPPQVAPALIELGQHFLQRSPATVAQWQEQGLRQALQLQRLTEQFCLNLELDIQVSHIQRQALQIICKRREKDLQRLAEPWGIGSLEAEISYPNCQSFEQVLQEYRWQQRVFQCTAWLLELHGEKRIAQNFQTCSDNLVFDFGFLQLAYARSIARGQI